MISDKLETSKVFNPLAAVCNNKNYRHSTLTLARTMLRFSRVSICWNIKIFTGSIALTSEIIYLLLILCLTIKEYFGNKQSRRNAFWEVIYIYIWSCLSFNVTYSTFRNSVLIHGFRGRKLQSNWRRTLSGQRTSGEYMSSGEYLFIVMTNR